MEIQLENGMLRFQILKTSGVWFSRSIFRRFSCIFKSRIAGHVQTSGFRDVRATRASTRAWTLLLLCSKHTLPLLSNVNRCTRWMRNQQWRDFPQPHVYFPTVCFIDRLTLVRTFSNVVQCMLMSTEWIPNVHPMSTGQQPLVMFTECRPNVYPNVHHGL